MLVNNSLINVLTILLTDLLIFFFLQPPFIYFSVFVAPLLCLSYLPYPLIDSDLEPFTTYEYRVRGWNSFGRGSSDVTTVTTSEDKPWGVAPPRWSRLGERDDIIQLLWQAPAKPNGVYVCVHASIKIHFSEDAVQLNSLQ